MILDLATASSAPDTLLLGEGRESSTWVEYTDGTPTATRQFGLPFGNATLVGGATDRVALIEDEGEALTFLDEFGDVARRVRRTDVNAVPVSASLRGQLVRHAVQSARARGGGEQAAKAGAESLLGQVREDRRVSPFDLMLSDPTAGRIWVRDYQFEWNAGESRWWTVHDSTGQVLARLTTPASLRVTQVGPDHVVGVELDDLGVEYVVVYRVQ